jgi:ribosomal protein L15
MNLKKRKKEMEVKTDVSRRCYVTIGRKEERKRGKEGGRERKGKRKRFKNRIIHVELCLV